MSIYCLADVKISKYLKLHYRTQCYNGLDPPPPHIESSQETPDETVSIARALCVTTLLLADESVHLSVETAQDLEVVQMLLTEYNTFLNLFGRLEISLKGE